MTDDLVDVIATLRNRRAGHLASVELLDRAIADLSQLQTADSPSSPGPSVSDTADLPERDEPADSGETGTEHREGPSVYQAALDLAGEADRPWSAHEIVVEYQRRGTPIKALDPMNAMFSALSRAAKKGTLVRVSPGRYKAAKWLPSDADERSPTTAFRIVADGGEGSASE